MFIDQQGTYLFQYYNIDIRDDLIFVTETSAISYNMPRLRPCLENKCGDFKLTAMSRTFVQLESKLHLGETIMYFPDEEKGEKNLKV